MKKKFLPYLGVRSKTIKRWNEVVMNGTLKNKFI